MGMYSPFCRIFRKGSTHRPGLCPEDEAPTGQLTNEIISGRLESS
jgi:hypothetical protein